MDIIKEEYKKMGRKTTVCLLTVENGFEVVGTSACVDAEEFNYDLGKKYAKEMACRKLEELEGYRMQDNYVLPKGIIERNLNEIIS